MPHRLSKSSLQRRKAWRKAVRLRHFRYVSLSQNVWKRRMVFLAGAMAIGLTAVAFAKCADWAQAVYRLLVAAWPWLPLLMTPLGFAVLAYITRLWFPAAAGSGIPQVIAARKSPEERHRLCLLGFPVMIAKIAMTTLALVIGASVGREGPTVQVGASVMFAVAGVAGMGRQNGLVLAGSGAGIAAAFNAPLAGIVFAIEELAKAFTGRINEIIIGSVAIGGAVSWAILGNYPYFGEVSILPGRPLDWLAVPVCALFGGVLGGLFSRIMVAIMCDPPLFIARLRGRPLLFAALCGLAVAGLSVETSGYAAGSGYGETSLGLEQGALMPWWFGFAKLLSTLLSSISGLPGGLFSPSLATGAGMGSMAAHIFTFLDPRVLMLLMMAGYFSGVVQSPLTATVIVMEMTSDRNMVIPLLVTSLFAASISRLISREPLYHALARNFAPQVFHGRRWQPQMKRAG